MMIQDETLFEIIKDGHMMRNVRSTYFRLWDKIKDIETSDSSHAETIRDAYMEHPGGNGYSEGCPVLVFPLFRNKMYGWLNAMGFLSDGKKTNVSHELSEGGEEKLLREYIDKGNNVVLSAVTGISSFEEILLEYHDDPDRIYGIGHGNRGDIAYVINQNENPSVQIMQAKMLDRILTRVDKEELAGYTANVFLNPTLGQ